jgi:hypothetical protein
VVRIVVLFVDEIIASADKVLINWNHPATYTVIATK